MCELGAADKIARVRKGWYPSPVLQSGIPAHVVGMQVRAEHEVDVFRRDPERAEAGQEGVLRVIALVPARLARARLMLADAGVDQDDAAGDTQDDRMDRQRERVALHILRLEPVPVLGQRPGVRIRKQPAERQLEPLEVHGPIEPGIPDRERRKRPGRG